MTHSCNGASVVELGGGGSNVVFGITSGSTGCVALVGIDFLSVYVYSLPETRFYAIICGELKGLFAARIEEK